MHSNTFVCVRVYVRFWVGEAFMQSELLPPSEPTTFSCHFSFFSFIYYYFFLFSCFFPLHTSQLTRLLLHRHREAFRTSALDSEGKEQL